MTAVSSRDRPTVWLTIASEAVLFSVIYAVQWWLIFRHSPWRDETQALLIAQQPLPELFGSLRFEGHPALWYLLLQVLAPAGVNALPLAQALVSGATLALIWLRSPFGPSVKVLASLGYFVFYEYGVIARSYGLGAFLILAFFAFRRSAWSWLILALLCNVSFHTALIAGLLACWQVADGRWSRRGALILFVGAVIALITVWPAHGLIRADPLTGSLGSRLAEVLGWSGSTILPEPIGVLVPRWLWRPDGWGGQLLGIAAPILGVLALRARPRDALLLLACYLTLAVVGVFVYMTFPRHFGLAMIVLLGLLWVAAEDGAGPNRLAGAWLLVLALSGSWFSFCAAVLPFSPARGVVEWATAHDAVDQPWAAMRGYHGLDFSGLTGRRTFNLQKGCWNTFQRWDYGLNAPMSIAEERRRIDAFASAVGGGYLLSDEPVVTDYATLAKRVGGTLIGDTLFIYRVTPKTTALRPLPTCR